MKRSVSAGLLLVFALGSTRHVLAFGNDGHKIVCAIAVLLLDVKEQDEITRLTKVYKQPDGEKFNFYTQACTFPDKARRMAQDGVPGWTFFSQFNNWHFLNVPRDTKTIDPAHCGDDCVLKGIDHHAARLANKSLEEWKRAEAMFFLGHWIGDIHQPLHISFKDDRGGNDITPIHGNFYPSEHLHGVWDSGIIGRSFAAGEWFAHATKLKDRITPEQRIAWLSGTPRDWAQESYTIATTDAVDYCKWEKGPDVESCNAEAHTRKLTAAYQKEFQDEMELRLQQAGVRLAAKLRAALGIVP